MMKGKEIRKKFLEYFVERGHVLVPSSSLIPKDDPTLLFTNAGMVQFKNVFLGTEKRDYKRAVSVQKCVRAGGKHNDLDNVGYTARHHTFFEMLGNFSFGDYFKKEAISYAWDLMTNVFKLPEEKLYVTVFREDDEAYDIWKEEIGLPSDRIVRMGEKDNFWSMGDTGPCGPCSEIIIDQGEEFGCGKSSCRVGCDCDRYLELWNLVFMQYNRDESGKMVPIPNPSIDTGMGLERITAVIQGVKSNYETDLFMPIIARIEKLSSKRYGESEEINVSMRVIADHARAVAFLITDGVFPSNEGRGYVLRRILRRGVRHAKMLGASEPFIYKVLPAVNETLSGTYPELEERAEFVSRVVKNEEERFLETIDRGLELLEEEIKKVKSQKGVSVSGDKESSLLLPGEVAFKLYDTFGFPYDLTEDIARTQGILIDRSGYEKEMEKQRKQSRKSWKGTGDETSLELFSELAAGGMQVEFTGYEKLEDTGVVRAIIKDGVLVDSASEGMVEVITDRTPFYGRSGGQVGDRGLMESDSFLGKVVDTKKPFPTLIVHSVKVEKGTLWVGDKVRLRVDSSHRLGARVHHTCTHILHATLREILGEHVRQAGSLVAPDKLRFDFTHFEQVDDRTLSKIEEVVNERIRKDDRVVIKTDVPYDEAIKSGATAIFEEKYGDRVRIVSIGDYSKELCGGTHLDSTGQAGLFKIVTETASSSGIRRIEAVAGESAWRYVKEQERVLRDVSHILRTSSSNLLERVVKLKEENERFQKELESLRTKNLSEKASELLDKAVSLNGMKFLVQELSVSPEELRAVWDSLKQKIGSGIVILGSREGGKAHILVGVTKDLSGKYHAGKIVKDLAQIIGGGGGGRPDMAQAGGSKPENLPEALKRSSEIVRKYSS